MDGQLVIPLSQYVALLPQEVDEGSMDCKSVELDTNSRGQFIDCGYSAFFLGCIFAFSAKNISMFRKHGLNAPTRRLDEASQAGFLAW